MGSSLSFSHVIPTVLSKCRRRTQELPIYNDEHTIDRKISDMEKQTQQYIQQQIQPYHLRLQDNVHQIEVIKQRLIVLEETQKTLVENQIIEI